MSDDVRFDAPDPFDDELRRRFASGATGDADPDAVLDAMRPRLQRARTRRRASIAGALGGAAVVVVVVLFVLGAGGGGNTGSVHTPPATHSPVRTLPTAPTTGPSGGSATPDSVPAPIDDHGVDAASGATTPTTPEAPGDATATSVPPALTPPANEPPSDTSYSSDGGSIVVRLADGALSLVSSAPAPGFSADVHDDGATRVEVRFSNGSTEWRIRVDLVNGQPVPEVTQHG